MRRVAFINEKGGTCKTTLCVNIGAWLAREKGLRVLLADLDTQGHAGKSLGLDVRELRLTIRDLLLDAALPVSQVVKSTAVPGLDILPANKDLAAFPVEVATEPGRAEKLAELVARIPEGSYQVLLFDAPPSVSLVTENVMRAASEVVIPVALTYLALDGCAEVLASIQRLRAERGEAPALSLVVPTLYRRTQLAEEILETLRRRFPQELSRTVLGYSVKVDEAQSHGRTIFEYAPRCSGALALAEIARAAWDRPAR
jgi:chromosome partitioning protein